MIRQLTPKEGVLLAVDVAVTECGYSSFRPGDFSSFIKEGAGDFLGLPKRYKRHYKNTLDHHHKQTKRYLEQWMEEGKLDCKDGGYVTTEEGHRLADSLWPLMKEDDRYKWVLSLSSP